MAHRFTIESNAIARPDTDFGHPQQVKPTVMSSHSATLAHAAVFDAGKEGVRLAYAMIATPTGKVSTIHSTQTSRVKGNGRVMAAIAPTHSLRIKANQATPQTRL